MRTPFTLFKSLLAFAGLGLPLLTACGDPQPPVDANLLIVSVDTLRADRLGAYGNREWHESTSPRLDALAQAGVLFETAYAPRGQTHPSLSSLLTGKYPITTGLRENGYPLASHHKTFFEHLQTAGFQTGVFVANLEVTNEIEEWVARGADVASDGFGGRRAKVSQEDEARLQSVWDDRVERAAMEYLDAVDADRPFALWAHFYDVHKPYNPPKGFVQRYGMSDDLPPALVAPKPKTVPALEAHLNGITLGQQPVSAAELTRVRGLYDSTVRATDDRLGRLLEHLEAMGELESTYVVFTSDHGDELGDHNRYFYHGSSIYDGVVRVPLVIKGPDLLQAVRIPGVVRLIDVAPTILDLLGLPPDASQEGTSLAGVLRGESPEPPVSFAVIEWQDLIYAVSDGRHKFIWNPRHVHTRKPPYGGQPPNFAFRIDCIEGYDLQADPLEQLNQLAGFDLSTLAGGSGLPEAYRPLYEHLVRFLADPQHKRAMDLDVMSDAQRKRLAQLGYLHSVSARRTDSIQRETCVER
jgi:arylsulfatase A-like enzyme